VQARKPRRSGFDRGFISFGSQRLGAKVFDGEFVNAGAILVRQRGTSIHPGENVGRGSDDTLFATSAGLVKYGVRANRRHVSVVTE